MTADKPESQEICFVPGGDYRTELRRRAGWTPEAGPIVDADGRMVGEHAGAAAYTVGQRKGLGVALGEPRYVARIDAPANLIQLGRREDLRTTTFGVDDVSFVSGTAPLRHRALPGAGPHPAPGGARPGDDPAARRGRPAAPALDGRDRRGRVGRRAGSGVCLLRRRRRLGGGRIAVPQATEAVGARELAAVG